MNTPGAPRGAVTPIVNEIGVIVPISLMSGLAQPDFSVRNSRHTERKATLSHPVPLRR